MIVPKLLIPSAFKYNMKYETHHCDLFMANHCLLLLFLGYHEAQLLVMHFATTFQFHIKLYSVEGSCDCGKIGGVDKADSLAAKNLAPKPKGLEWSVDCSEEIDFMNQHWLNGHQFEVCLVLLGV
jgi:hypothetical protein